MSLKLAKGFEKVSILKCEMHIFNPLPRVQGFKGWSCWVHDGKIVKTAHYSHIKDLGRPIEAVEKEYSEQYKMTVI